MDISSDHGLDWDKLDAHLNRSTSSGHPDGDRPLPELTAEEREMLEKMEKIRISTRKREYDRVEAPHFSVQEGWERFIKEEEAQLDAAPRVGRKSFLRPWTYGVAASVVVAAGVALWFHAGFGRRNAGPVAMAQKADLPPARGVQLVLGNGRTVDISHQSLKLKDKDGSEVSAVDNVISYAGSRVAAPVDMVLYNSVLVPRGNNSRVTLADGTQVWLNAQSKLTYPTTFPGASREVTVEGEAYFEVAPRPDQPFIVHTSSMDVQVLGTSFDVNTYHTVGEATLTSGRIRVKIGDKKEILKPGEQAQAGEGTFRVKNVDTEEVTAWKDNELLMEDATFGELADMLGRTYDYTFVIEDPTIAKLHFRLDMTKPPSLQTVLDHICKTTNGISFVIRDREVRITR